MKKKRNISIYSSIILGLLLYSLTGCIDTSVKTPGDFIYKASVTYCTGCGDCVAPCPEAAIRIEEVENDAIAIIDPELCIGCGECYFYCDLNAIEKVPK